MTVWNPDLLDNVITDQWYQEAPKDLALLKDSILNEKGELKTDIADGLEDDHTEDRRQQSVDRGKIKVFLTRMISEEIVSSDDKCEDTYAVKWSIGNHERRQSSQRQAHQKREKRKTPKRKPKTAKSPPEDTTPNTDTTHTGLPHEDEDMRPPDLATRGESSDEESDEDVHTCWPGTFPVPQAYRSLYKLGSQYGS
jgi:hypothetical protein